MNRRLNIPGMTLPIIQAPMAGISTPEMAAAVSNSGGLGSLGIGNLSVDAARIIIQATRKLTDRPINVNVFCHQPARANPEKESQWLEKLTPQFQKFGAVPPDQLREIYISFLNNRGMLEMLLDERPEVVSFHFGLPEKTAITALKAADIYLIATATTLNEAKLIAASGIDAIVAQGYEAGGHRGVFDPDCFDDRLGTMPLSQLLVKETPLPIIAAGGIMDGAGIQACLQSGAVAAQLGTAFLLCPEAATDEGYRRKLQSNDSQHTVMTNAISGRPARSLPNYWTSPTSQFRNDEIPAYPIAYDAAKTLHQIAKTHNNYEYGAQWAGQGAPLVQSLPAKELMQQLSEVLSSDRKESQ
ncbi:NAD(P)H-dependent flavin oxidoreductase [Gimesia sp.]|uniref:NAD(P)H-dependent flavin oxidoreductase n=1 Tax=Gimesia sp. TaxID=2024833 RepID=UPI003A921298